VSAATFKVMVIGDITSQIAFTVPESIAAVKAGLKDVPGAQVLSCDSKGDPNAATACERSAVDAKVSAVVSSFGSLAQDEGILNKAGIPTIGVTDSTSPISFSLAGASYIGLGPGAAQAGCKAVGTLDLDGTDFLADIIKKGLVASGSKEAARAAVPSNAPDLAPAIARLVGAKADCIVLSVTPNMVVQAMTAISQTGAHVQVLGVGAIFPQQVIKALGQYANGAIATENQLDAADGAPIIKQIRAEIKAVDSTKDLTTIGIFSWASARLISAAVKDKTGDVSPADMLASLNSLRDVDFGGALHNLSMAELPNPAFKRLFNHYGINYKIDGGVPKREGDFYDLTSAAAAASQ
jgi:ABC-type branched-subunit amino acid transport system substrate-binding protein